MSHLACCYNELGKKEEAVKLYEEVVKIAPNTSAYYNMAICLDDLGKIEAEVEAYRKVIELEPEHPYANYN